MSFSQRKGIKPAKSVMQTDSMDDDLRNGLWNCITLFYWGQVDTVHYGYDERTHTLLKNIWIHFLKLPIDEIPDGWYMTQLSLKDSFFKFSWNEIYDFIEFLANNYGVDDINEKFINACNFVLEKEMSGYRFVDKIIAPITSEQELAAIEEALAGSNPFKPVNTHLNTALERLSDRKTPDYRNSIKESISAVEAISRLITNNPKATLGEAIKKIKEKVALHPALEKAFNSLYGYTSDKDGIRHSLMEESNLKFQDAKYMLVTCSAFISYLIEKSKDAGIKF
jgi:hypothetical protein